MWRLKSTGNLNKKMHHMEFCWTGGTSILMESIVYIGLGIYKAGTNTYWRDKSQFPRQIVALRLEQNVNGMVFFSSTSFKKIQMDGMTVCQNNYFRYPALIAPMSWIDSGRNRSNLPCWNQVRLTAKNNTVPY